MKSEDLRELLLSIAEEDAIISRLYTLFVVKKGYHLELINNIIMHGMSIGWFEMLSVETGDTFDMPIDWKGDNTYQEIVFCDIEFATNQLFNNSNDIPDVFRLFLVGN